MISTVTNKGTLRFKIFDGRFTADVFLDFLKRLIRFSHRKIYLIVDNLKVHHANKVREWVAKNQNKIEIFYLPSYSPEMNPDELLNQDVKSNAVGRKRAATLKELKSNVCSFLRSRQKMPEIIKSYFRKKEVAYAA